MKSPIMRILAIIALVVVLGSVIGFVFLAPKSDLPSTSEEPLALAEFSGIELRAECADVTIREGSSYSMTYHLDEKEVLTEAEVVDGTLFVTATSGPLRKPGAGSWSIVITVPKGTALGAVDVETTNGSVTLEVAKVGVVTAETLKGAIAATVSECEALDLETDSGDIVATGPIENVEAETILGKIFVDEEKAGHVFHADGSGTSLEAISMRGDITIVVEAA